MKLTNGPIKLGQPVEIRIEPNLQGTHWIWSLRGRDGTKANGYAKSAGDAMHDAAAFVEAMSQPRRGGMWTEQKLRVVGGADVGGSDAG